MAPARTVASDPRQPALRTEAGEVGQAPAAWLPSEVRTGPAGLSQREAQRRLLRHGPHGLQRTRRTGRLPRLVRAFTLLLTLLRNRPITAAASAAEVRS